MSSKLKLALAATAVGAAILVPLYGDPRSAMVTHPEWAHMLLGALDLDDALPANLQASHAFSILSWKNSLSLRADRFVRGDGVEVTGEPRRVVSGSGGGEVVYALVIARGGDYKLRVRVAGDPAQPVQAEIASAGAAEAVGRFSIAAAAEPGWIEAGSAHLDPGAYTASLGLPPATSLERIEVAPPCLSPMEPPGGWKPAAPATTSDVAVTVLQALDLQSELPSSGDSIEALGNEFQVLPEMGGASFEVGGRSGTALTSRSGVLAATVAVELTQPGLYSVSAYGAEGGGQSWLANSCQKAVVCASADAGGAGWRHLMTAVFSAGRHLLTVRLGPGAAVERVRFERKQDAPEDYLKALRALGFDPGPEGPIARAKAEDARDFIRTRRNLSLAKPCGDPVATTPTMVASLGTPGGVQPGPVTPPVVVPPVGPGPGPGPAPIQPPLVPPPQPGSRATP